MTDTSESFIKHRCEERKNKIQITLCFQSRGSFKIGKLQGTFDDIYRASRGKRIGENGDEDT